MPEPWQLRRKTSGGIFRLTNVGERRVLVTGVRVVTVDDEPAASPMDTWMFQLKTEWPARHWEEMQVEGANAREPSGNPRCIVRWRELDDDIEAPDRVWSGRFGRGSVVIA